MLPASSKGGGQALAFPDVCKTPTPGGPVPLPYPNMGMLVQVSKESQKVKIVGKGAVTKKSEIPRSQGDEPGTAGGVVSNMNMGKITFKQGSSKVKVEGQPLQHLTAPTAHNGANANVSGMIVVPSQAKVFIAPGPTGPLPDGPPLPGVGPHEVVLAASSLNTPEARMARRKVVRAFIGEHGREWDQRLKDYRKMTRSEVESHVRCHDPTKPIKIGPPPPCPSDQVQWQRPNGNQGQYYTNAGVKPDQVGTASHASTPEGEIVPKVVKNYKVKPDAGMSRPLLKLAPDGGSWSGAYEVCSWASSCERSDFSRATRTGRFL